LPIKNKKGQYYSILGSKLMQVTEYSHGHPFKFDEIQARSSGITLRRFHDILSETNDQIKPKASLYPSSIIIKRGIHALEKMRGEIPKEWIYSVNTLYDKVIGKWETKSKNLSKTIIHGDWHQGNQLYNQKGEVCYIMDFDYMTRAERIFDVAYALWCFRINKEAINIAKAFMQGYGSLSNKEVCLLPLELARINYFFICSSGLSPDAKHEFESQYRLQYPFMMWALSKDGENTIKRLCEK
jgi:Ser/Thr protein kinase RdoA (MazF antagonist)